MSVNSLRLFVYKLARDFGFAPNPFFGVCSLATCKPQIRTAAKAGDLVFGCGSKANDLDEKLIFAMRVENKMAFNDYWQDPEFQIKKPNLRSSNARGYGDNIYHKEGNSWVQADSHHSFENGQLNVSNLARDTGSDNVLLSRDFVYWGREAVEIPDSLRDFDGDDIYPTGRGHRSVFSNALIAHASDWFDSVSPRGRIGRPAAW